MKHQIEQARKELAQRKSPLLVERGEDHLTEMMLVNTFFPKPRIYFSDYSKPLSKGLRIPKSWCYRIPVTEPIPVTPEGLFTGDLSFSHPDYAANDFFQNPNPEFVDWTVFRIKGTATAINQSIFMAFSRLVHWSLDLARSREFKLVELSTRYMLFSSRDPEHGVVLKGDLVSLQDEFNVYVHLIPEIAFYDFLESEDEPEDEGQDNEANSLEPVLDLHPDLLAMMADTPEDTPPDEQ